MEILVKGTFRRHPAAGSSLKGRAGSLLRCQHGTAEAEWMIGCGSARDPFAPGRDANCAGEMAKEKECICNTDLRR